MLYLKAPDLGTFAGAPCKEDSYSSIASSFARPTVHQQQPDHTMLGRFAQWSATKPPSLSVKLGELDTPLKIDCAHVSVAVNGPFYEVTQTLTFEATDTKIEGQLAVPFPEGAGKGLQKPAACAAFPAMPQASTLFDSLISLSLSLIAR